MTNHSDKCVRRTGKGSEVLARLASGQLNDYDRQLIAELRRRAPGFTESEAIDAVIRTLTDTCQECKS